MAQIDTALLRTFVHLADSCSFSRTAETIGRSQSAVSTQIRKLEELRAQEGEAMVPLSMAEFLERVRRIGDNEVVEVTASSAAICAFSGG